MKQSLLPRLTKTRINASLKSRNLEDLSIIRDIEKNLLARRGYVFQMPKPGESAILLFSGGLDTTATAAILMEEFGLKLYPVFTRRGQAYQAAEEAAADYFTTYFQKRYPGQFHTPLKIATSFPPHEIRWAYESVEDKPIEPGSKQIWGDYFYSSLLNFYAAQAAYFYQITEKKPVRTIFTGYMRSDGEGKLDMTLTTMRAIMYALCTITHDFRWQVSSLPLEKEVGFFYDKDYFIKWAEAKKIPLHLTRSSCRTSRTKHHCGNCLFCNIRRNAFHQAGVPDRTIYKNELPLAKINQKLARIPGKVRRLLRLSQ